MTKSYRRTSHEWQAYCSVHGVVATGKTQDEVMADGEHETCTAEPPPGPQD